MSIHPLCLFCLVRLKNEIFKLLQSLCFLMFKVAAMLVPGNETQYSFVAGVIWGFLALMEDVFVKLDHISRNYF